MAESEQEKEVSLERVPIRDTGKTQILARGPGGKFVRLHPHKVDPKEIIAEFNDILLDIDEKDPDKKLRLEKVILALYAAALDTNPDCRTAQVKAQELILTRVMGKPSPSPETLEALEKGSSVKVIVMQAPKVPVKQLVSTDQKTLPEFAEVAEIRTNEE